MWQAYLSSAYWAAFCTLFFSWLMASDFCMGFWVSQGSSLQQACALIQIRGRGFLTRARSVIFSTRSSYASMNLSVLLLLSFLSSSAVYFSYLHTSHQEGAVTMGKATFITVSQAQKGMRRRTWIQEGLL